MRRGLTVNIDLHFLFTLYDIIFDDISRLKVLRLTMKKAVQNVTIKMIMASQ